MIILMSMFIVITYSCIFLFSLALNSSKIALNFWESDFVDVLLNNFVTFKFMCSWLKKTKSDLNVELSQLTAFKIEENDYLFIQNASYFFKKKFRIAIIS